VRAAGTLTADADVLPTIRLSNKTVRYVDFGFRSAEEFWAEVVMSSYERFKAEPTRANALTASGHAWHVHEWIWHDQHPGEDTRHSADYKEFQNKLFSECPELAWIRDVADASKHRGLGRPAEVRRVTSGTRFAVGALGSAAYGEGLLIITLTDDSTRDFAEVLSLVINYWRAKYFP
jgi:hypothetical protein